MNHYNNKISTLLTTTSHQYIKPIYCYSTLSHPISTTTNESMLRAISNQLTHFLPHTRLCLFTHRPSQPYHMSYLMDSKHDDKFVKIDRRAFHLYKDSILKLNKDVFNEKIFILVIIDCVRTKQKYQDFEELVQFGVNKINQFTGILSIFSFVTQLYLYNYSNKQLCFKVAQKGFELLRDQPSMLLSSFYTMKFLIFIEKCVGLEKFPNQTYSLISFNHFKPLYLCFTLEMFFKNKLQHYPIVNDVLAIFTTNSSIIPFADLHHYILATKIITLPKYREFIQQLEKQMMVNPLNSNDDKNSLLEPVNKMLTQEASGTSEPEEIEPSVKKNSGIKTRMHNQKPVNEQKNTKGVQFPWHKAFSIALQKRYTYFPFISSKKAPK